MKIACLPKVLPSRPESQQYFALPFFLCLAEKIVVFSIPLLCMVFLPLLDINYEKVWDKILLNKIRVTSSGDRPREISINLKLFSSGFQCTHSAYVEETQNSNSSLFWNNTEQLRISRSTNYSNLFSLIVNSAFCSHT